MTLHAEVGVRHRNRTDALPPHFGPNEPVSQPFMEACPDRGPCQKAGTIDFLTFLGRRDFSYRK